MKAIFYTKKSGNIGMVYGYHEEPEKLQEYELTNALLVEDIVYPTEKLVEKAGYEIQLFVNLEDNTLFYDYTPIQKTEEELLKDRVAQLEQLVADLASLQLGV
jgi:hypothetical protein